MKKSSRRNKIKNPNLKKQYNTKIRQLYMDQDYLDDPRLTPEDLAWYDKFLKETLNTNFKNTRSDFHKTKKAKRQLYNENNARNRCLFNNQRAIDKLDYMDQGSIREYDDTRSGINYAEDTLIDLLDNKGKPFFDEENED